MLQAGGVVRLALVRSIWTMICRRPIAPLMALEYYAQLGWRGYRLLALTRGTGVFVCQDFAAHMRTWYPVRLSGRMVSSFALLRELKADSP